MSNFYYLVACRPLENNYKYWLAVKKESRFDCKYGRIGSNGIPENKSESEWNKKLRESCTAKKGYIDRSEFFEMLSMKTDSNGNSFDKIHDNVDINNLLIYLMNASNKNIQENYVFSDVLPNKKLFTRVNQLLNDIRMELKVGANVAKINELYLEVISLSQRKIAKVKEALFTPITNDDELGKAFERLDGEQDLLNTLESEVTTKRAQLENELKQKVSDTKQFNYLEQLGLTFELPNVDEVKQIHNLIKQSIQPNKRIKQIFKVTNKKQQEIFDKRVASAKNKDTMLLWHGSRTPNYLSIMEKSLLIRPSFAGYQGSLFDDGLYFANFFGKSRNYTDGGYYVGGTHSKIILLLFDVHVGNIHHLKTVFNPNSVKLSTYCKQNGYDSVYAHKGLDYRGWNNLQNDEIIVYSNEQCAPRFIVEFVD